MLFSSATSGKLINKSRFVRPWWARQLTLFTLCLLLSLISINFGCGNLTLVQGFEGVAIRVEGRVSVGSPAPAVARKGDRDGNPARRTFFQRFFHELFGIDRELSGVPVLTILPYGSLHEHGKPIDVMPQIIIDTDDDEPLRLDWN